MADLVTEAEVLAAWPDFDDKVPDAGERAMLITSASNWVEQFCNRVFASAAITEVYSGRGQAQLYLRRPPFTTAGVSSVTVDGVLQSAGTFAAGAQPYPTDRTLWRLAPVTGARVAWPAGVNNISIAYTGGYASTPPLVKRATISFVRVGADYAKTSGVYDYEQFGQTYQYKKSSVEQSGGAVPQAITVLLTPYRIPREDC